MSTQQPTSRFRPLTPKDMEEYKRELEANQAAAAALQNPELQDPITPEPEVTPEPQEPSNPSEPEENQVLKKRLSDKDRFIHTLSDQNKTKDSRIAELEDKLKQQAQPKYASDEEVANFESTVNTTPVLKELIRREALRITQEVESRLTQKSEQDKALSRKQVEDVAKVSKAHPDWPEYDTGAPLHKIFIDWLTQQPIRIQEMADYTTTGDMDSAIAVLTMFKAQVSVKSGTNTTRKPTATNPASSRADIPADPKGKFDIAVWDKAMDDALRLRNRKEQDRLMLDLNLAKAEGRL